MIRYLIYAFIAFGSSWFFLKDVASVSDQELATLAPAHAEKAKYIAREAAILACFDVLNPNAQRYVYSDWTKRNRAKFEELSSIVSSEFDNAPPSIRRAIHRNRKQFNTVPTFRTKVLKTQGELPEWANSKSSTKPSRVDERALRILGGELSQKSCQALSLQVRRGELDIALPLARVGENSDA